MSTRRYTVSVDDRSFTVDVFETAADRFVVSVDGRTFEATLEDDHDLPGSDISPQLTRQGPPPRRDSVPSPAPAGPGMASPGSLPAPGRRRSGEADAVLVAPMPGVILEVPVAAGAQVRRGDPVVVLEAMKMRNTIRSPRDAVVVEVAVSPGQAVGPGEVLVRLAAGSP